MISSIAIVIPSLLVLCAQGPGQAVTGQSTLAPGNKLVSAMLARYHNAKTLTANIHMTQSAMNKTLTFNTELVYERPQKIYLVQKRSDDRNYSPQLVSDAVSFAYTAPSNIDVKSVKWFKETTHPKEGQINIEEMWAGIKPELATGDDSFALESLISRMFDLKSAVPQLVTCENKGKVQIGSRLANDVEGTWKAFGYGQTGTYQLYITDEGDLLRQTVKMAFQVSAKWLMIHKMAPNAFPDGIETVTTWDISAAIDQPVDETLFKVPS